MARKKKEVEEEVLETDTTTEEEITLETDDIALLDLDMGREDLNTLVAKVNELINKLN